LDRLLGVPERGAVRVGLFVRVAHARHHRNLAHGHDEDREDDRHDAPVHCAVPPQSSCTARKAAAPLVRSPSGTVFIARWMCARHSASETMCVFWCSIWLNAATIADVLSPSAARTIVF